MASNLSVCSCRCRRGAGSSAGMEGRGALAGFAALWAGAGGGGAGAGMTGVGAGCAITGTGAGAGGGGAAGGAGARGAGATAVGPRGSTPSGKITGSCRPRGAGIDSSTRATGARAGEDVRVVASSESPGCARVSTRSSSGEPSGSATYGRVPASSISSMPRGLSIPPSPARPPVCGAGALGALRATTPWATTSVRGSSSSSSWRARAGAAGGGAGGATAAAAAPCRRICRRSGPTDTKSVWAGLATDTGAPFHRMGVPPEGATVSPPFSTQTMAWCSATPGTPTNRSEESAAVPMVTSSPWNSRLPRSFSPR